MYQSYLPILQTPVDLHHDMLLPITLTLVCGHWHSKKGKLPWLIYSNFSTDHYDDEMCCEVEEFQSESLDTIFIFDSYE